jgi:hypothetical protein
MFSFSTEIFNTSPFSRAGAAARFNRLSTDDFPHHFLLETWF